MMLVEQTQVSSAALPIAAFKDHLRLGTGFADQGAEDPLLEALLRAALAAIEAWTGKALLERPFAWTLPEWRDGETQALPMAPVREILAIKLIDRLGWEEIANPAFYRLEEDTHRPLIRAQGSQLPMVPNGGRVTITFKAGFGPFWDSVPPDLAQAVMVLAAHYYEYRHEMSVGDGVIPYTVSALIERWRTVRLLGGHSR